MKLFAVFCLMTFAASDADLRSEYRSTCLRTRMIRGPIPCTLDYSPICASNGREYANLCSMADTCGKKVFPTHRGNCREQPKPRFPDLYSEYRSWCKKIQEQGEQVACPFDYAPICASDGKNYSNLCSMAADNCKNTDVHPKGRGECKQLRLDRSPDLNREYDEMCATQVGTGCPFIYDPICGSDHKSYSNMCTMAGTCNTNVRPVSRGECTV